MSESASTPATTGTTGLLQKVAMLVGVVFILVGVLGFVPGITSDYSKMTFMGHDSGAALIGIFQVSILHNIVHLLFGVVGLALARTASGAKLFLVGGGVIYLILFLYGLIIGDVSSANFVPLNMADDVLHLVLGIGMVGIGFALGRQPSSA